MKILILGAGTVGETVAYNLAHYSDYEITVIDKNEAALQKLATRLDIQTVLGSVTSPSVLKEAGAEDTELLISATGVDDTNLVACRMAKEIFNIPNLIARVRQSETVEYTFLQTKEGHAITNSPLNLFDVTESICPEQIVTEQLLQLLLTPGALQVVNFGEKLQDSSLRVQMIVTRVEKNSPLVGHALGELKTILLEPVEVKVCAIYRNEALIIPTEKTRIISGDEIYFICLQEAVRILMGLFRPQEMGNKKIMIVGGGNIGYRLAKASETRFSTKIIEKNTHRAEFLAEKLDEALVLQGSANDEDLLQKEHISEVDMFFSLTNNNEDNIMSSLLAKKMGAKRVAAIINRSIYVGILVGNTIDIVISPHLATIGSILSHIRKGDVVAVHPMRRGEAEALEVIVHGDEKTSKITGRKSEEISWPYGIDLVAIISEGQLITSTQHEIREGDHLIFFAFRKHAIRDLEKLLQVKWQFF
ncbi:MAG: Trk system potassium transporter TrkA [Neisseriaceae bacterium]